MTEPLFYCLPVELISLTFVFVREALFELEGRNSVTHVPTTHHVQPRQSLPLLIGAVCKRWRDISLATPQLWTDIIVNPLKCPFGQLEMVGTWAERSISLPLNISIYLAGQHCQTEILNEFGPIVDALRSLSSRWNDLALRVPGILRNRLLHNLEKIPLIRTFYLPNVYDDDDDPTPIKLQLPIRPERLISFNVSGMHIPFQWDRLVFLELEVADFGEILHIIHHAQNLTHCIAGEIDNLHLSHFPIAENPITNRSLVYLQTSCEIICHLTLPSLLHLNYVALGDLNECFDSISDFLDRSRAPLDEFILRCYLDLADLLPPFEQLPEITSLFIHVDTLVPSNPDVTDAFVSALTHSFANPTTLPRLKSFSFTLPCLPESSWTLLGRLFPRYFEECPAVPKRPLANVLIQLTISPTLPTMNKETFLHFSEIRRSGLGLLILDYYRNDVLCDMAKMYDMEPFE